MQTTKKLIAAQEKFTANVVAYIVGKGATPGRHEEYELATNIGVLKITPYDNWIACRFDDVEAAQLFCACNKYSGKWNFHYSDDVATLSTASTIGDFMNEIERLLAYVPSAAMVAKADELRAARAARNS
jgi:hypothetical protein